MNDQRDIDPDLQLVESIYDALYSGKAEEALRIAAAALAGEASQDPVLHFLAGIAHLELDSPEPAVNALERAVEIDPEDAEFRANLAMALYCSCRFDEARTIAHQALELEEQLPDAHYVSALLLERSGRLADAEEHFARAAALDHERFPAPHRLSGSDFEECIAAAREMLSEEFKRQLDRVVVTVEELPSDEIIFDETPPLDPELFGLFVGVPLTELTSFSPGGELPPRILLFKRNLERCFSEPEELKQEIANTLHHELGHYLGMDEEDLEAIDLL
jgi:predicted Zn-dependent protease with MMP-like domain